MGPFVPPWYLPQRRPLRLRRSGRDITAALISTNYLLFNIGWYWSVLGGSGSILDGTGQYLVVLGHYWVVLFSTWWYWVIIAWHWSVPGGTESLGKPLTRILHVQTE